MTNTRRVNPPTKTFGGKWYLAPKIVELMTPHTGYLEPFFGGGSVLLAKDPVGVCEIANDLDRRLMNFFRVLQTPDLYPELLRRLSVTPFSQTQYRHSVKHLETGIDTGRDYVAEPCVDLAFHFFVVNRQSMGGRMDSFCPTTKRRTRGGMNADANAWLNAVNGLSTVVERLKRVSVRCEDAMKLIPEFDEPGWMIYCDSPYHHETRESKSVYRHEMSHEDHVRYLRVLSDVRSAKVMVSSYPNDLYDNALSGWRKVEIQIDNKASKKSVKDVKTEVLWLNY
jgi:DNA adenine methylase